MNEKLFGTGSKKMKAMCTALVALQGAGIKPTRKEIVDATRRLEGKQAAAKLTSSTPYFRSFARSSVYGARNASASVIARGLVEVSGKRGRQFTYAVTQLGRDLALGR